MQAGWEETAAVPTGGVGCRRLYRRRHRSGGRAWHSRGTPANKSGVFL